MARRQSVMVIDDSATALSAVASHVAEIGFIPITASSVNEALTSNLSEGINFVLIDLIMPDVDGFEGITAIAKLAPNIPIIAMSAGDASREGYHMLRIARRSGADAVIEKPFDADRLKETIELAVERHSKTTTSIVILDDSRTVCAAVERMLVNAGYDAHAFTSPDDVLNNYRILNVDVLITDIFMPEKSGIDVIRECQATWPDLRVVAMSAGFKGMPKEKALAAATKLGASAAIGKPFKVEEIDKLLKQVTSDLTD